jgi:hypothetical protein
MTEHDSARIANCLVRFQQRDADAADEFRGLVWPYLKSLSRKIAPYLSADLHEDVAQQASLLLLTGYTFNPSRAAVQTFLPWVVRTAARKVWADSRPPGARSRTQKAEAGDESADLDCHEMPSASDAISLDQIDERAYGVPAHDVIITRTEIESLVALADPLLAAAFQKIYEGNTLTETAAELRLSRYKLARAIAMFGVKVRLMHSVTQRGVLFSRRSL